MSDMMHLMHLQDKTRDARGAFAGIRDVAHYLGMNLTRLRQAKGLNQRELADMIGVNQSTIQRAEAMHPSAKLDTYKKCAEILGVSLADIFSDDRSAVELQLVKSFRAIPEDQRDRVLSILDLVRGDGAPQV
ncbi:helix-turn-helix domain-containing protein [Pelagovum pacificum]|uniref:Helix-turn-helix transcriptional regulator n=1 Tax=Pelagovum pacificum TaxID=2588711 RepID=A0A5C5GDS2_9RHOB|nr:helix-turn-helix transcriptional regulator [Pelagovum pacificum]QQA43936.1 helix-turn-helix transcriptional regulator [Pelagovum pacificum]TNY32935.1 helix-turn-helix transcriptional regulator [Pelagovum pacificum]